MTDQEQTERGARSTVEHVGLPGGSFQTLVEITRERDQLRAALETARAEIERLRDSLQGTIDGWFAWDEQLKQSRATVAELRAKVERQPSVIRLAEDIIGGHSGHLPGASSSCPRCQWDAGLAALDAAEQPARAEEGQD